MQGTIESAIFSLTKQHIQITGAGRTDAGVHAFGQVANFSTEKFYELEKVQSALNFYLKDTGIAVISVEKVSDDFSARFSAKSRSYVYKILNRRPPSPLLTNRVWHITEKLDSDAMHEAAQVLIGTHDLTSFRSVYCQSNSPIKTISAIRVEREGDIINIHIEAPSFLYNQVRITVGCLRKVGNGKWDAEKLKQVLEAKDRTQAAATAPPFGLYLNEIKY